MSDSIFMSIMEAVRDQIRDLELTGIEDNRIQVRRLPHDGEVYFPGITVHPVPETYDVGDNKRESVGYGVAVTMVVNNNNNQDYLLDRLLLWRENIRRDFVEKTVLSGVSTVCTVKVEHGHVIDWDDLFDKNYDVSRMILRVYSLETRT